MSPCGLGSYELRDLVGSHPLVSSVHLKILGTTNCIEAEREEHTSCCVEAATAFLAFEMLSLLV